ncbi:germination protein YpeB [Tumebacillus algifaecis]|uniref:Germination protein YpeB n=1 Tax=Tumebacillus algifaecis TaxID=1214604 RepID=A0A223D0M3_9BACL|nr:germination protein YpeB [Tumebacillus algifaecis]ASS75162.1 germination protein YpeB [Tumebacillus algifaecis]
MFSKITSLVLAVALVVAGFWGYREHKEKQALLLKTENQYQRAFHDLSDRMNLLQDQLGKSLAINTKKQLTPSLTEVWRLAAEARTDVGQLPLSLMPFNNTMEFINDVGNFSYRTAVDRDGKEGLNEQEFKTLNELYKRSKKLENQLAEVQSAVIKNNLRWMDAELALTQTEKKTDNQILDGFHAMEKSVKNSTPLNFGPTLQSMKNRNRVNVKNLSGQDVNEAQAAQIAAAWLGRSTADGITAQRNGKGAPFLSHTVTVPQEKRREALFTITVRGGKVTNMLNDRTVLEEKLDLSQASQKAIAYLNRFGINDSLEVVNIDTHDHIGVFDLVPRQGGVRLYPDKVIVQVALDNGEILGVNSREYVFNHKPRTLAKPKISQAQARTFVSSRVKVQETALAVAHNVQNEEVLAYEFVGTMDNDTYKIFISALNGDEVGIEKLN